MSLTENKENMRGGPLEHNAHMKRTLNDEWTAENDWRTQKMCAFYEGKKYGYQRCVELLFAP